MTAIRGICTIWKSQSQCDRRQRHLLIGLNFNILRICSSLKEMVIIELIKSFPFFYLSIFFLFSFKKFMSIFRVTSILLSQVFIILLDKNTKNYKKLIEKIIRNKFITQFHEADTLKASFTVYISIKSIIIRT